MQLPIPIVFIGSAEREAFANDRGGALLGLPPGETNPQAIIDAMARLRADIGDDAPTEISIGSRRYRVETSHMGEAGAPGLLWLFHEVVAANAGQSLARNFPPLIKAMLDKLEDGVMLIDGEQRVLLWNDAYLAMLDLPPKLLEQGSGIMPMIRLLADRGDYGPGDPVVLSEHIARIIHSREPARGERQMADGKIIAVEWIPLPDGYLLFCLRNVTHERTASRFKDELISTVSHELRTPLTVISGALGLLRAGKGGQTEAGAAELIDVAYKNSDRLARLVNDLLDIDKLQSTSLDFAFESTDMGLLLCSAVEQNLPYSQGLGIAIDLEVPDESIVAEVDRGRLLQVMSNLLSNAAKFSSAGSHVRVRLTSSASGVRISIIDAGRGMSPEFCRRLFTRFAQENRASEHGQIGTGLGLAICKSIVDRHHGQILVDTREGVGTTFHVDLPYDQAETPAN